MRNKVTSKIRKETVDFNNNRVAEANNESELWKIAKEVTNPQKISEWSIEIDGKEEKEEKKGGRKERNQHQSHAMGVIATTMGKRQESQLH